MALLRRLPKQLREMDSTTFDLGRIDVAVAKSVRDMLTTPQKAVLLLGEVGIGKTHLLVSKFKQHIACCVRDEVLWYGADDVAEELRLMALHGPEDPPRLFELVALEKPFHLYWDDLDKMKLSESADAQLFRLLNGMMLLGCRISATTNMSLDELGEIWSPALLRRLTEMLDGVIEVVEQKGEAA